MKFMNIFSVNKDKQNIFQIKKKYLGKRVVIKVVSKSGNPGPGPVPKSYFLYYIFIKALILIKFEHNA